MVSQYPHTITIKTVAASTQDSDGNWIQGSESEFAFKGRYEPNKESAFLPAADGKQIVYSGIVYALYSTPNIGLGTSLIVTEDGNPKALGKVLQFNRGQLNVRIWMS